MKLLIHCAMILAALLLSACDKMQPHLLSGAIGMSSQSAAASQPGSANIPIIWVWGQSNAVGLGQSAPSVLNPGVIWRGLDYPRGIGAAFGNAYQQATGRSQVIVAQCAVGGTGILQWQPGGALFNQCFQILQNIKNDYPNAQVATMILWQGEYDAQTPNVPWAADFSNVVRGLRAQLGDAHLPIEFCQIDTNAQFGQAALYPYWSQIQAQQASVGLPLVSMVKTSDITGLNDSVHVAAAGLVTIGERLEQAYFGLLDD